MLAFHSLASSRTTRTALLSSLLLLSPLSPLVRVLAQDSTTATSAASTTGTSTSTSLSVTVWYLQGQSPQATLQAQVPSTIGGVANTTTLALPAAPTNVNPTYTLNVELTNPTNASIPIPAGFFGFSIEMSVANQICERSLSLDLLNYLGLVR
jgi:hypothetical protein